MQLTAKLLAFYLFLGSVFPRTDFSQLTKIPGMIEHYNLHVEEAILLGTTYDIWVFIDDHFINPDDHTHEGMDNPHENLPLASVQSVVNFILEQFQVPPFSLTQSLPFHFDFFTSFHLTGFTNSIFHPPSL